MTQIVSSISGIEIYAPSAGYAPTNSGDVSAIASAYQVVSATGTQLYAGTAHVTSINSAPISASRAGNAANAALATSAWYDGTGRLISSLPDSAAVSSIASAYAPTFGLNDGKISSINGSALDTPTGGGVVTATGSGLFQGDTVITTINESSLTAVAAHYDALGNTIHSYYAPYTSFTGVSSTVANNSASWGAGVTVTSPSGTIVVNGGEIEGTNSAVLTASSGPGFSSTGYVYNQYIPDNAIVKLVTGILPGTGGVLRMSADSPIYSADILLTGQDSAGVPLTTTATVSGDTRDIAIPLGTIDRYISARATQYITMYSNSVYTAEKTGGIQVTGVAELAWKSAVDNVTNTVSSNSATWGQGGVDSATVSAIASSYAESAVSGVSSTVATNSATWGQGGVDSATVSAIASAYQVVSSVRTAYDSMAISEEVIVKINDTEIRALGATYATYDSNNRVLVNLPGSSEVSAIASAYQVVSSIRTASDSWSMDGEVVTRLNGTELRALNANMDLSGRYLTSLPGSSEVSAIASSYAESAVSSKADSSALSSYALSSDVSGCIDTVANNSASWGQGGAVTSPSGTIYVSGSTIEASNSALDVKYTPDWSSTGSIDDGISYLKTAFSLPVSGSGVLSFEVRSYAFDDVAYSLYGLPGNVLITSSYIEHNYMGVVEIGFPTGYTAVSASIPHDEDIGVYHGNATATASGAAYSTTSVGTLAWSTSVQAVANSSMATANGVLYILTGNA